MDAFTDKVWNAAISNMAAEARFAAELLAGRMPQDIDTVFVSAKCSLFPRKSHDLETDCSCPDWANPCKHVAAVHYVLGEAFDRDPFLLFELRGRSREQVLNELSRLRSGGLEEETEVAAADAVAAIAVQPGDAADYETPPAPLPALRFSFEAAPVPTCRVVAGAIARRILLPAVCLVGNICPTSRRGIGGREDLHGEHGEHGGQKREKDVGCGIQRSECRPNT
jgi:hypothetical protein